MHGRGTVQNLHGHTMMNESQVPEAVVIDRNAAIHPPTEIELKLSIAGDAIPLLRSHTLIAQQLVGHERVSRIDNRYFDTSDRLLAQARMALRLRRIGRRWMQTLKATGPVAAAFSQRHEWEVPLDAARLDLGALRDTPFATLGSPRALGRRIEPVFVTNFRREIRDLLLPDGTQVECAIDVGTIQSGSRKSKRSARISEVEFELKGGDAGALLRLVHRLARDVPMLPLPVSKAERGYALADGVVSEPVKAELPEAKAATGARAHLARVVAACQRALLLDAHGLHASGEASPVGKRGIDPEFVHQARVAVRRMRSALRTFRPVFGKRRFETMNATLRAIGQVFGDARDWDVFCEETMDRIARVVGDDDAAKAALKAVHEEAVRQKQAAYVRLLAYLGSAQAGSDAIAIERFVLRFDGQRGTSLGELAPRWLEEHQRRVVKRARRIATLDDSARHRLRIEVKRLRYALDLLDALYDPEEVHRYRKALSELQDALGELNDAAVAVRLLQSMGESAPLVLARERFSAWVATRLVKRLPKIGALSVAFELTRRPWESAGA